jgi:hypothetical protein
MLNFVVRDLSKKQQTVFFRGSSPEEATEDIISKQLPEVVRLNAEGVLSVENIDVFCEKGVFDVDQVNKNNHLKIARSTYNMTYNNLCCVCYF